MNGPAVPRVRAPSAELPSWGRFWLRSLVTGLRCQAGNDGRRGERSDARRNLRPDDGATERDATSCEERPGSAHIGRLAPRTSRPLTSGWQRSRQSLVAIDQGRAGHRARSGGPAAP